MSDKKIVVSVRRVAGPLTHTIGDYTWDAANGFTTEVDVDTAAGLLTEPRGRFSLAPGLSVAGRKALAEAMGVEPKNIVVEDAPPTAAAPPASASSIVGGKRSLDLAGLGITEARQLAALDDEGIERLAATSGASRDEVRAWVSQAKRNEVKNG